MNNSLFDKIYGCLVGGLIGDAMGAPSEGMHYRQIAEKFGEIRDFQGEGTDDSAIKMILCKAILENGGEVTADEFAESFLRGKQYERLFYHPVHNMLNKVRAGLTLPVYAGLGNMQSSSSAMAISPMGIINALDPRQAALETYDVAGLIHAGDTTFCRDAACAMAAAVAEALKPEATVEGVLAASVQYLHKISSAVMREAIARTLEAARQTGKYETFREAFYGRFLQEVTCDSRETVPCALSLFWLAKGDPNIAIPAAANFGRDADTIGTMVGALCGALKGASAIKAEWVEKADKSFAKDGEASAQTTLAWDLIAVVAKRNERRAAALATWDRMSQKERA